MRFKVGDIVRRTCNDARFTSNQIYGRVIGFETNLEDSWVRIEGEYYYDSLNRECINYFNPKYLEKVEDPGIILVKSIKKFSFK